MIFLLNTYVYNFNVHSLSRPTDNFYTIIACYQLLYAIRYLAPIEVIELVATDVHQSQWVDVL